MLTNMLTARALMCSPTGSVVTDAASKMATPVGTASWPRRSAAVPAKAANAARSAARDVIGAQHRFSDLHRPAGVDLTIDKPTSGMLDATEVVPDRRRINVIGAAGSLNDPKRALRLVEPCRVFVHHCQIVQQRLDLDNTSAIVFFGRRNRGQVESLGCVVHRRGRRTAVIALAIAIEVSRCRRLCA
jgi:hypothetical protein